MSTATKEVSRVEVLRELAEAGKAFHKAVAALHSAGELREEELNQARERLKRAARLRKEGTPEEIAGFVQELGEQVEAHSERLKAAEDEQSPGASHEASESESPAFGIPAPVPFHRSGNALGGPEELSDEQLKEVAVRHEVVSDMLRGLTATAALSRRGVDRSPRWARKMKTQYLEHGYKGLYDQRWNNGRTDRGKVHGEIRDRLMILFYERPAAGPKLLWKKLKAELLPFVEEGRMSKDDIPSYSTVQRYLAALPRVFKVLRKGGLPAYDRLAKPVFAGEITRSANERWQSDHSTLPIWIRVLRDGEWVPSLVWLTVSLDAHSRAVAGFVIQDCYPNSWTVAKVLMHAIEPKSEPEWTVRGLPQVFQTDQGRDFLSHNVVSSLSMLGIIHDVDPGEYPERKGRCERFFGTVNTSFLKGLPGHKQAIGTSEGAAKKRVQTLLTREQLEREFVRWIVSDYHVSTHEETGRKPIEHWEETVKLLVPESKEAWRVLLLKSDHTRIVRRTGVDFHRNSGGGRYWAPELAANLGREVRLRYHPDDLESVLVSCAATDEYLCEAWKWRGENNRYTVADVKRVRSQYRRGLRVRLEMYLKELTPEERKIAERNEWTQARKLAKKAEAKQVAEETPDTPDEVEEMVTKLKAKYRTK